MTIENNCNLMNFVFNLILTISFVPFKFNFLQMKIILNLHITYILVYILNLIEKFFYIYTNIIIYLF